MSFNDFSMIVNKNIKTISYYSMLNWKSELIQKSDVTCVYWFYYSSNCVIMLPLHEYNFQHVDCTCTCLYMFIINYPFCGFVLPTLDTHNQVFVHKNNKHIKYNLENERFCIFNGKSIFFCKDSIYLKRLRKTQNCKRDNMNVIESIIFIYSLNILYMCVLNTFYMKNYFYIITI